jgi:hypothetical protein
MVSVKLNAFYDDESVGDISQLRDSWFFADISPLNMRDHDVYVTKSIDAFRQGVEIIRQRHYDAGIVKIHAGEPGHRLRKNRFGMDAFGRAREDEFLDNDKFNSVRYIQSQEGAETPLEYNITFPFYLDGEIESEAGKYDGVIEPLTIRPILDRSTIDAPFEMHTVRGDVMGGTPDLWRTSCLILNVDRLYKDTRVIFYDDRGYFLTRQVILDPYDDTYLHPLGDTDSYVNPREISATAGWDFDSNVMIGTDSIAFGGMGY